MNKEKGNQEFKLKDFAALAEQVKASRQRKKVVVAAAEDLHTLEGINQAYRKGMITPILVGNKEKIIKIMEEAGFDFGPVEIVPTEGDQEAARQAVALIGQGKGDVLMKGRLQTADLLKEVVSKEHGLACGGIMSHVGLFELPGYPKLMVITDGGMLPYPTIEQKVMILNNGVETLKRLGYQKPKVAVLAATEVVNPKMPESLDGGRLKEMYRRGEIKDCIVEGPISFDLMYSKESAEVKGYESPVTGDTDILLVPTMATGNLLAKALLFAAKAKMAGIIVGAQVPIVLVSRGATAEEKYLSLLMAAAVSK